jgi:hypothetical protein
MADQTPPNTKDPHPRLGASASALREGVRRGVLAIPEAAGRTQLPLTSEMVEPTLFPKCMSPAPASQPDDVHEEGGRTVEFRT